MCKQHTKLPRSSDVIKTVGGMTDEERNTADGDSSYNTDCRSDGGNKSVEKIT